MKENIAITLLPDTITIVIACIMCVVILTIGCIQYYEDRRTKNEIIRELQGLNQKLTLLLDKEKTK
jgi:hypothetical protein